jgi:hypothetical protein
MVASENKVDMVDDAELLELVEMEIEIYYLWIKDRMVLLLVVLH